MNFKLGIRIFTTIFLLRIFATEFSQCIHIPQSRHFESIPGVISKLLRAYLLEFIGTFQLPPLPLRNKYTASIHDFLANLISL